MKLNCVYSIRINKIPGAGLTEMKNKLTSERKWYKLLLFIPAL